MSSGGKLKPWINIKRKKMAESNAPVSEQALFTDDDFRLMARAIRLAEQGFYSTHPNPAVGCVIARQGKVVGTGYHVMAGGPHAEAAALAVAGDQAMGATVYVTLEPCSFEGRTPSCAKTLVERGVKKVVVSQLDPDPRNAGAGIRILEQAGIEVVIGLLAESGLQLIRGHSRRLTENRPYIRLKLAMSMDGGTALANGDSKWITSSQARADVQKLRARSSAIVTGVDTVIADNPRMSVRAGELRIRHAEEAARIPRPVYVLDSTGRIPGDAALNRQGNVLVTTAATGRDLAMEELVLPAAGDSRRVDLRALIEMLAQREHSEVLFECGQTLAGSLVSAGLADELVIYMAPSLMGSDARSLLKLAEIDRMADLVRLRIVDTRHIGTDLRVTLVRRD